MTPKEPFVTAERPSRKFAKPSSSYDAPPTFLLLVVDIESRRFTVEGPLPPNHLAPYMQDVDRALAAGRNVFCVPLGDTEKLRIAQLGIQLGYEEWPAKTIVSFDINDQDSSRYWTDHGVRIESRLTRQQSDEKLHWLNGIRTWGLAYSTKAADGK